MTINLAIEYIPRRMRELGYDDNYIIRFRHFVLVDNQLINVRAFAGEFYLLVEESSSIKIESECGIYDRADQNTNELIYEHHGEITIFNKDRSVTAAKMIQVIPQHKK